MAYRALRTALYTALAIFSAILLGVSSSRVRYTNRLGPRRFYDSIIVELIVTSILALLWSLFLIFGICLAVGGCLSFLTELIGLGILWVMFLVGAAIVTRRYHNLGYCRGFNLQCRLLSAILSWSWVCWAVTTFLLLASLAAIIFGKHSIRSAVHGSGTRRRRGRDTAVVGTTAAGGGLAAADEHRPAGQYNTHPGAPDANMNMTNNPATSPQAGYPAEYEAGLGPNNTGHGSALGRHHHRDNNPTTGAGGNAYGGVNPRDMVERDGERTFTTGGPGGSVSAAGTGAGNYASQQV